MSDRKKSVGTYITDFLSLPYMGCITVPLFIGITIGIIFGGGFIYLKIIDFLGNTGIIIVGVLGFGVFKLASVVRRS